ncbi:tetratricopeptide repeat protein [Streptomyces sp. NPDC005820]|uniref:tetratricopeptide repeat protein n=1 Tax=Streptomyces sp. NPDC005820 TaxID=3157069 RepID=UPI0033F7ACA2
MPLCNRPDCGRGEIDEDGFCPECDRRPLRQRRSVPRAPAAGPAHGVSVGVAQVRPDPWYGLGLIDADHAPEPPDERPAPTGPVAEEHRFCLNPVCARPVGRGHDGEPGRTAGFCARCGTRFDFAQPQGLTIAGRYDVERLLDSGAYGTAYLVHDRNLETRVVLKALHRSVARTARHERDILVGLRHDSIVRILGYEPEGPHLVLEYVPGAPFCAREGDRLEILLGHGLRILQALDYLHARGLLHCDVKPLNIIRFREEGSAGSARPLDRVRLIDFGAVRSQEEPGPVVAYTKAYAPPEGDPEHLGPSPGFDLYGLGRTLEEVCGPYGSERTAPGVDSLMLLIERATDIAVPQRRFVSAQQFGEQLSGVIRQIVAAPPTARQVARPSALFGPMTEPLHGGLGAARPLAHWVRATAGDAWPAMPAPFSCPGPRDIAAALPTPLSDPDDPRIGDSAGTALAESRLALRRGDPALAARALARSGLPDWHWLHAWYSGLLALAREDVPRAVRHFTEVRRALPGELIPQLALGLCAEILDDREVARSHYGTVFDTTPALGAAGFGLARVHLLAGRRAEAVAAAERLTQEFRYEREARVAAVRLLITVPVPAPPPAARPQEGDLARARTALDGLHADDAVAAALRAEIEYAAFLGTHDGLRLSEAVRELGAHASAEHEYVALVDLANRLRPVLEWRWPRRRGRTGHSRFRARPDTLRS